MTASTKARWIAAALLVAASAPARAQSVPTDARWQAWLGCWAPAARVVAPRSTAAAPLLECIVPATGSAGVDVATIADTQVVMRDRVEATGERRVFSREGCTGWVSAQWSPDGRRVYTRSEYSCAGGLERKVSGLMAISAKGDWLDVQAVTTGDRTAVRSLRYRPTEPPSTLPAEVAAELPRRGPDFGLALTAAAAAITPEDVVEASRQVDSAVVEAWLGERGQGFRLNGARLLALADAGVPGGVIDVMVALSYPRTFTVGTAGIQQQASGPADESRGISGAYSSAPYGGWDPYANYSPYGLDPYFRSGMAFGNPYACGPFGYSGMYSCDAYNPYGYGAYGYGRGGYGGYGYNPYGYNAYGYNGGYNGWMYGGGIIVIEGNGAASQPHGRVVAGRGYTQGSGSASTAGRDAQPRPRIEPSGTTGSGSSPQPRSSGGSSGGSQPSSGGSSSSSGSSSGSSTGGGRTAHPKPPSN
jgi:uncharacterized membrane protein YgcG